MRTCLRILPALLGVAAAFAQSAPAPRPSDETIRAWQNRRFGLFIHWGLYSTLGGVWNGRNISNGYSEQIMSHAPIPKQEYEELAAGFNPTNWDPDAIVRLAQSAGMKFIVITSKHHDGFNMFATRLTPYNVLNTPYHRDVVKELSQACARHGMGFGVYYSSIDWHYPGATPYNDRNDNAIPKAHEDFNAGQIAELMTGYGPMSEIWFDMGKPTPAQSKRFADTVHRFQPQCMVSGRVFNYQGDFTVMGDNDVPDHVIDEPWQTPGSIYDDTWGYRSWAERKDLNGKINEHILRLVRVVSHGGNYLLNIGPRGDGSVVEFEADVLRGIGRWLSVNGEAIYDTEAQPFRNLDFGYATVKEDKLYLIVTRWPQDGKLVLPRLRNAVRSARLLADPTRKPLVVTRSASGPVIEARSNAVASPATVIEVQLDSRAEVMPPEARPQPDGSIVLGKPLEIRFYNYNGYGYEDPPTVYKQQWEFSVAKSGRYRVEAVSDLESAGRAVQFSIDGKDLPVMTRSGHVLPVGTVELKPGRGHRIAVTPPRPFEKGTRLAASFTEIRLRRESDH